MLQALLAIQNILQNSNIFNRARETVLFTPFGDTKVTQFSETEIFHYHFNNLKSSQHYRSELMRTAIVTGG